MNNGFPPEPYRPVARPMFRSLGIAASGLSAQRQRMEVAASNIANAETTRTEDGQPYRRKRVVVEAKEVEGRPFETMPPAGEPALFRLNNGQPLDGLHGVRVTGIVEDAAEGPLVYDPGHPDADAAGYVRYPNVRITDELLELMEARRVFEANATVFQSVKAMLRSSIDISR
jgi:flagellar basal-body rod protein FlgC